jgi:peptidyl-prolyl cis-trans isomerase C
MTQGKTSLALLGCVAVGAAALWLADPAAADHHDEAQDDAARRAQVLVEAGDVKITVGEVEDAVNAQSPILRARYRDGDKLEEFVRNMVRFELLAQEAERRGFDEHEAVVRTTKQNAVQQLIRREFDERITPESVSDEQIREYYESHPKEFRRPEMVRASHILVSTEQEAKALLEKLKDGDARTFRQLAREHSKDTETKHRGGDLRYFTKDGRPPGSRDAPVDEALVEAAFKLREVGDISQAPVPVGEDFSILILTGRRAADAKSLEDATQSIRLRLWRQGRQEAVEQFVDGLRKKHKPEVHPDRMRPIQLDTAPGAAMPTHDHGAEVDEADEAAE